MGLAVCYDPVFGGESAEDGTAPDGTLSDFEYAALMDLEFSDFGRDPRLLPGWYILPSIIGGLLVVTSLVFRFIG